MSLKVIYVTRHGFRSNWVVERDSGVYHSSIPSPTGIPSDPALAGYGASQAHELAAKLVTLEPPIERFYSSPFYRCIQTLYPTLEQIAATHPASSSTSSDQHTPELQIYGDNGLGEWYGTARFDHPSPAAPSLLKRLFPRYVEAYVPSIVPSVQGETITDLHDRTAYALHRIIERCDAEGVRAMVLCTHAATMYAVGRALTGRMPEDVSEEDFKTFTCGLSKFVRRVSGGVEGEGVVKEVGVVRVWEGPGTPIPEVSWREGKGVQGGWDCEINGDCSFLSGGEERGWRFSGDESFIHNGGHLDAGAGLGMVVEGREKLEAKGGSGVGAGGGSNETGAGKGGARL